MFLFFLTTRGEAALCPFCSFTSKSFLWDFQSSCSTNNYVIELVTPTTELPIIRMTYHQLQPYLKTMIVLSSEVARKDLQLLYV